MIIPHFLKEKSIVIMGLGITGRSAFEVVRKVTDKIILGDDFIEKIDIKKEEEEYIKDLNKVDFGKVDYLFLSPGINTKTNKIIKKAKRHKVEIISDIDMLYQSQSDAFFIAVTGTNGKTTTASMIYHALKKITHDVEFGGNNGSPCLFMKPGRKIYVLEISSFQINLLKKFKANIGILLNLQSDHLDVYKTKLKYAYAKSKLASDLLICNMDFDYFDKIISSMVYKKKILLSSNKNDLADFFIHGDYLVHKNSKIQIPYINTNIMNTSIAMVAVCMINDGMENAQNWWSDFRTLSHRREVFNKYKKTIFINDSKATNISATLDAVLEYKNIHLVIGGILKEKSFSQILKIKNRIEKIYIYGKDKDMMENQLCKHFYTQKYQNINEIVNDFFLDNVCGSDIVFLLSPMAASFDQFKDFKERGDYFMDLVNKRVNERKSGKMVARIR